jgi:hypothetical protein
MDLCYGRSVQPDVVIALGIGAIRIQLHLAEVFAVTAIIVVRDHR